MFKLVGHDGIQAAVSVVDYESDALHILLFGKCREDHLILDRTGAGVAQCIIHDHTARQLLRRVAGGGSPLRRGLGCRFAVGCVARALLGAFCAFCAAVLAVSAFFAAVSAVWALVETVGLFQLHALVVYDQ